MRWVALLLVLTGCTVSVGPSERARVSAIPDELRSCPAVRASVPLPPRPRTMDSIVRWAAKEGEAKQEAVRALEVCRARLVRVIEMVER